ncbi:uncharacterized protein LOC144450081 [Glandiceps talaboti]
MEDYRADINRRRFKSFFENLPVSFPTPERKRPRLRPKLRYRSWHQISDSSLDVSSDTADHARRKGFLPPCDHCATASSSTGSSSCSPDNPLCTCPAGRAKRTYKPAWTERQLEKLHWYPARFPNLDPGIFSSAVDEMSKFIVKICIERVIQWLLEPGTFEPPIINKSEVSTITVSEAVKNEIRKELEESHMCTIAERVLKSTKFVTLEDWSNEKLNEIITGVEGVPPKILTGLSMIFYTWLQISQSKNLCEINLDRMVKQIVSHIYSVEEEMAQWSNYEIRVREDTRREFELGNKTYTSQSDVEVLVNQADFDIKPYHVLKVLTISENKLDYTGMDRGYPKMGRQFMAAAKDTRFITDDHHIMYGISLCGTDGVLLSRGHVWKQLTERTKKCIKEDSPFQKSHFLYQFVESGKVFHPYEILDIVPVLTVYLASKAALLLHQNTLFKNLPDCK